MGIAHECRVENIKCFGLRKRPWKVIGAHARIASLQRREGLHREEHGHNFGAMVCDTAGYACCRLPPHGTVGPYYEAVNGLANGLDWAMELMVMGANVEGLEDEGRQYFSDGEDKRRGATRQYMESRGMKMCISGLGMATHRNYGTHVQKAIA